MTKELPGGKPTRHQPFVEASARARKGTARWARIRAGLLVLTLLDRLWSRWRTRPAGQYRRLAVRRAIRVVRPRAMRQRLNEIVDLALDGAASREALQALDRYADRLAFDSDFALANHVYQTISDVAKDEHLTDLLPATYEHAASCLREQGEVEAAFARYAAGLNCATECGDVVAELRIEIARANLHRVCGESGEEAQLIRARDILAVVLRRAKALDNAELTARAAHECGIVAHALGHYIHALSDYADAYHAFTNERDRSRLLNDIARSLRSLGYVEEARAVWRVVYLAKGELYAHWAAAINLMATAYEAGEMMVGDQYARALARAPMPARLLLYYWKEYGEGCARFGRLEESVKAYVRAAHIARRHGFPEQNQLAIDAIHGCPAPATNTRPAPADLPPKVRELLAVVRALPLVVGRWYVGGDNAFTRPPLRTSLRRGRPPRSDPR
jgi:tetratricopeptide (TPR) repeat protein